MAKPVTLKFSEAVLLFGDGATVEDFEAICGIENLTVTYNIETESEEIPDCDTEALITWLEDVVVSKQVVFGGEALLTGQIDDYFTDWVLDDTDEPKNLRFMVNLDIAGRKYYLAVPGKLTAFEASGERRTRWRASFTINGQGKPSKVSVPD